jgi:hypothetical protein
MAYEYMSFEDLDFLLKRNWFVCDQDIHDLLAYADDDTFWELYAVRDQYARRIRQIIAPLDYIHDKPLFKHYITDLTNDDIERTHQDVRRRVRVQMENEWTSYLYRCKPERPPGTIDEEIEAKRQEIEKVKEELKTYRDIHNGKDRNRIDQYNKRIQKLWDEEAALQDEKSKMDEKWLESHKLKFQVGMI